MDRLAHYLQCKYFWLLVGLCLPDLAVPFVQLNPITKIPATDCLGLALFGLSADAKNLIHVAAVTYVYQSLGNAHVVPGFTRTAALLWLNDFMTFKSLSGSAIRLRSKVFVSQFFDYLDFEHHTAEGQVDFLAGFPSGFV